jgi:hypothetical protein
MNKPVTKKLLQILAENPQLRVWAITRESAECVLMLSAEWSNLEMACCDGAWSCRPASEVYQQIMVFVPEDDTLASSGNYHGCNRASVGCCASSDNYYCGVVKKGNQNESV